MGSIGESFSWHAFGRHAFVFALDVVIGGLVLTAAYWFVRWGHCGVYLRLAIEHAAWPICVVIILTLFRSAISSALAQVPGFMARSSYGGERNDLMQPASVGAIEEKERERDEAAPICSNGEGELPEILDDLQESVGVAFCRNVRMRNTEYVFDAMYEHDGRLYGVEVLQNATIEMAQKVLEHVSCAVFALERADRHRFRLVLCVAGIGEDNESTFMPKLLAVVGGYGIHVLVKEV